MSISGTWKNEYGSTMILASAGNTICGTYRSTTGSSGEYRISGYCAGQAATPSLGQPVALAIGWHSVVAGPADPSWNWCSGLSGQIHILDGEEVLTLNHALIASSAFPGFMAQGNYIDKLTYRRAEVSEAAAWAAAASTCVSREDPLNGAWIGEEGMLLELSVCAQVEAGPGHVAGSLFWEGRSFSVIGFTDVAARNDGLFLQSVAICAEGPEAAEVSSLSGNLDLQGGMLDLVRLSSQVRSTQDRYLQTRMSAMRFRR